MHAINDIGIITIETHNQHIFPTEHTNLELKPGAYVVLKITDNGCGIDKSTKEKIWFKSGLWTCHTFSWRHKC